MSPKLLPPSPSPTSLQAAVDMAVDSGSIIPKNSSSKSFSSTSGAVRSGVEPLHLMQHGDETSSALRQVGVEPSSGISPTKPVLRAEVDQLRQELQTTVWQAESYVSQTEDQAHAYVERQQQGFQRAASDYEQASEDARRNEIANGEAKLQQVFQQRLTNAVLQNKQQHDQRVATAHSQARQEVQHQQAQLQSHIDILHGDTEAHVLAQKRQILEEAESEILTRQAQTIDQAEQVIEHQ